MAEEKDIVRVTDRMKGLCSRREYCRSDMMKKSLEALDGDSKAAERVVDALVSEKYIDDLRYSEAFARDKSAIAGWGAVKIRYMLSSKGISKDLIDAALAEIDVDKASDRLFRMMAAKAKSLQDDPQIRLKLLRFAMGRGYGYEEVKEITDRIVKSGS